MTWSVVFLTWISHWYTCIEGMMHILLQVVGNLNILVGESCFENMYIKCHSFSLTNRNIIYIYIYCKCMVMSKG